MDSFKTLSEKYFGNMTSYDLKANLPGPKWYAFRHRLSNFFLYLAKRTYAESPEVWLFNSKKTMDRIMSPQTPDMRFDGPAIDLPGGMAYFEGRLAGLTIPAYKWFTLTPRPIPFEELDLNLKLKDF